MKKLSFFCVFLFAVTSLLAKYSGGNGTEADPYLISNKADLKYLSEHPADWDKHFKQTANIAFIAADFQNGGDFYNDGRGFIPIGNFNINFSGTYNGQNFIIKSLTINRPNDNHVGMFGYTMGAIIKNLCLTYVEITAASCVGALVGYNKNSLIINSSCSKTGSVSGSNYIGGLVGYNNSSTIKCCYSTCGVSGVSCVGGLVGYNYSATVEDSYSRGSVTRTSGTDPYFGGLVGVNNSIIKNCYSTGSVICGTANDKGFVGGSNGTPTYTANFFDKQTSGQSSSVGATAKTTSEMKSRSTFTNAGWDFQGESANGTNEIWDIDKSLIKNNGYPYHYRYEYSGGSGTPSDPYLISNKMDLKYLSENPADWDKHFKQTANIDFAAADFGSGGAFYNGGEGFIPIGNYNTNFSGSYNGQHFTIDGIKINRDNTDYQGFFGYTNGATIQNLGLEKIYIIGRHYVGALTGFAINSSIISCCYSTGALSGEYHVGGLVGYNYSSTISSSYSTVVVFGTRNVGGLVGYSFSSSIIRNSYSRGGVGRKSGENLNFGGFIGRNYTSTIEYCYSTGSVSCGTATDKGFVGDNEGNSTYTANFFNSQTSGQSSSIGATAKTTTQMKTLSTFTNAGWDFQGESANGTQDIWNIDLSQAKNDGYPYLSWQYTPSSSVDYPSEEKTMPSDFALLPAWPNPFNPETHIDYHLAEDAEVNIAVYDLMGRLVQTLFEGKQKAGIYENLWNGKTSNGQSAASAVYFIRLRVGNHLLTQKVVLTK